MLGGGGIRGGQVIGASDAHAAEPVESPVSPAAMVATIYAALGVNADSRLRAADGKTRTLLPNATEPVSALV
jgi:hypothetical protein